MLSLTCRFHSLRQSNIHLLKRCLTCSSSCLSKDKDDKKDRESTVNFNMDDMILNKSQLEKDFEAVEDIQPRENLMQNNLHESSRMSENEAILRSATGTDEQSDNDEQSDFDDYGDDDIAAQILDIALQYVHEFGWSENAIDEAIKTLDISESTSSLFKRGAVDLVLHFVDECNNNLVEQLSKLRQETNGETKFSQSQFIENAIRMRLEMMIPYINTWPQAMMLLASPSAFSDCLESNANMIDEIWYHSGDLSHGMDWYTKRFALATLYASTELYMLQDKSNNYKDTWDFLRRRINDIKAAKHAKTTLENSVSDVGNLVNAGITAARNIIGQNRKAR